MMTATCCFAGAAILLAALPSHALTHYVDVNSTNPIAPYTNWSTAANVIQDAVDAAATNDTVMVTNGVYATGGRAVFGFMTNRVAVDKPLTLLSVNGPDLTIIEGAKAAGGGNGEGAVRCVYLTNGATISGFTLTNGATETIGDSYTNRSGGGVWCEGLDAVVSNCTLTGNSAVYGGGAYLGTLHECTLSSNSAVAFGGGAGFSALNDCIVVGNHSAEIGGGACLGTLNRCRLIDNSAGIDGGGSSHCTLDGCTLTGNSAVYGGGGASTCTLANCTLAGNSTEGYGGGVSGGTLFNCIAYHNTADTDGINCYSANVSFSCAIPLPVGPNITNAPLFVDTNNWSDLRLQSNSPCINAGNNAYVTRTNDLDRNPRIVGGTVDIGAYEFQSPSSIISYAWLQQYGLTTDGSVDNEDGDNDKATTWQEWKAWTDPTNELSVLRMLNPDPQTNGTAVTWQSVLGHSYLLERTTNAGGTFSTLQSNLFGQAGTTTFTDTTATNGDAFLYRVSVPE